MADPEDPAFLGARVLSRKAAPAAVVLKLLPYQEEGYGWMVAQEANEAGPSSSSSGGGGGGGAAAAAAGATTRTGVRGGILADEMGMGKTLQTICLLCHDKEQEAAAAAAPKRKGKASAASSSSSTASSSSGSVGVGGLPRALLVGPTLVVAPSSAMWQWHDEVLRSVAPGALRVAMYYGAGRSALDLSACDVVITTYPVLTSRGQNRLSRPTSILQHLFPRPLPLSSSAPCVANRCWSTSTARKRSGARRGAAFAPRPCCPASSACT